MPSGDLAQLFERALDELIQKELKRRMGAGNPRKRRELQPDSRHVPGRSGAAGLGARRRPVQAELTIARVGFALGRARYCRVWPLA